MCEPAQRWRHASIWGYRFVVVIAACLLGGISVHSAQLDRDAVQDLLSPDMGGKAAAEASDVLFVDPDSVQRELQLLKTKLPGERRKKRLRPLYEEYIDKIGANGILDGIEELWPKCHSQAHDLGKVVYAKVRDLGLGLRICADRCYSGCMHGVLMEAFTSAQSSTHDHINFRELRSIMKKVCYENEQMTASYRPPDCAHGVGHALMFLTKYTISRAIEACAGFDDPSMHYACITGAYMEYITERHAEDKKSKSLFYPCDSHPYAIACGRYKVPFVTLDHYRQGKELDDLIGKCLELEGQVRRGCFHGLGNAHVYFIVRQLVSIKDVCLHGDEQDRMLCIDGAMERMGKYHGDRALGACAALNGKYHAACRAAAKRKMYHEDKDLTLYLVP